MSTEDRTTGTQLYAQALQLYKNSENKELEKLFSKCLKKSYDVDFWNLYVDYVKNQSSKKINLTEVYSFVFKHFEGSYVTGEFARKYISALEIAEETGSKTEMIRNVYHRSFVPTQGLSQLWSEYEKWEMSVNRLTARTFLEQAQPTFMCSQNTYQRLSGYIENNMFFKIFDIEMENPLKLSKKDHESRLNFLFNYYLAKFPGSESLCFLYSFYLKDLAREKLDLKTGNVFLGIWYSFQYNSVYFAFDNGKNNDLITINYLNWITKNEGIDAARQKFNEVKSKTGVHVFIYMAGVEFYQGKSKEGAYQVFMEGIEKFGSDSRINEQFLEMFLKMGDDDNIRLIFNKLKKTEKMWDMMIEYEFQHGEIADYRKMLMAKQDDVRDHLCLKPVKIPVPKIKSKGCQGIYEEVIGSFGFMDLEIVTTNPLTEFIKQLPPLPKVENVLSNLDMGKVVALLSGLNDH